MKDIAGISQMLEDLNARLEERRRGFDRDFAAAGRYSPFELYPEMHRGAEAGEGPQVELYSSRIASSEQSLDNEPSTREFLESYCATRGR